MRTLEMAPADLHDRIRRRAYALWEEGRPEGRAQEHWLRAEAEVAGGAPGLGTPATGVRVCPACEGSGRRGRSRCKQCGGTGRIVDAPEP